MNPWQEVVECIEGRHDDDLMDVLVSLSELGRQVVAARLPRYLAERLAEGWEARWNVEDQASGFRLAGAACFTRSAQVATWLSRRELREVRDSRLDAERIRTLVRDRPQEWRADLAVRLVRRLRRPADRWRRPGGPPGWELAAGLLVETGSEPPEADVFVEGWVRQASATRRMNGGRAAIGDDPLLDVMVPRLFRAEGVAAALVADLRWAPETSLVSALAALGGSGRLKRQELIDGCAARFLAGGDAAELRPFVTLWTELRPSSAEIPLLDFVRLLPSAASPFVQMALDALGRADDEGLLDDELFAEAVHALAFRPEKKFVTAALRWIARSATGDSAAGRAGGALAALAMIFGHEVATLQGRAVKLAVALAAQADPSASEEVRTAAGGLAPELRERIAAAFGEVPAEEPQDPPTAAALIVAPLPGPLPPITSPKELAVELARPLWPEEPAVFERILAALVELTHRDRTAVAAALTPWRRRTWPDPFDARIYVYGISGYDRDIRSLLSRAALAVVSPEESKELTSLLADHQREYPPYDRSLQVLVQRRLREVLFMLEAGHSMPLLLATPTTTTGHVAPDILIDRMERLEGAEPLPADFHQALLRLPRTIDPATAVRAERLTSQAGRRLAALLRDGGLPDPTVTSGVESRRYRSAMYGGEMVIQRMRPRVTPPPGVPEEIRKVWTVETDEVSGAHSYETVWWPTMMPSHRDVVAAHLLESAPWLPHGDDGQMEALRRLVHGDGPVGVAVAGAIVCVMAHARPARRAAATDALVTLAARDEVPAAEIGRLLVEMAVAGRLKLNRAVTVLDDAVHAGAHASVWSILAEALPALLPPAGERPRAGLGDLLAVGARAAALTGARADIPELTEVATRHGRSRLVEEARRLHRRLSG
ncbi:DUF7824 domain-containing protein [Microtetraspora niveoalba]|uniref:DUF7824 domain-containing protein n=1 Tax=Microtetraspora niveoalba TaxID=46175 RepID=UPI000AA2A346|nr:DUF6493 family protein [Microtetraspora niveoalba]